MTKDLANAKLQTMRMSLNEAKDQATAIAEAKALQEEILAARGGKLLPGSSADLIEEARIERTEDL